MSWLCGLALAAPAGAETVTFEAGQGYTTTGGADGQGNLHGQPNKAGATRWYGGKDAGAQLRIVADPADASNQIAQTVNTQTVGNMPFYKYVPAAVDLGGALHLASSKVAYRFDLRLDDAPATSSTPLIRPRVGQDASGLRMSNFEFNADGKFRFSAGSKNGLIASTETGGKKPFIAEPGQWFTISGVLNLTTRTFTLFVNGVQQSYEGQTELTIVDSSFKSLDFTVRPMASGQPDYKTVSLDNVSLSIVP